MSENLKYSNMDQCTVDTGEGFFPSTRHQDCKNTHLNALQIQLNSQRTRLRSAEYEQAALKEKLNDMDVNTEKLTIANEFLSG